MWAEGVNALVLHLVSGQQVVCVLDENPKVTFRGDQLVLTTHLHEVSYRSDDVQKFTYTYIEGAGIHQLVEPHSVFSFDDNIITTSGLQRNSQVEVYSLDGTLLSVTSVGTDGKTCVALPENVDQTFIVKTSVGTFKIAKP